MAVLVEDHHHPVVHHRLEAWPMKEASPEALSQVEELGGIQEVACLQKTHQSVSVTLLIWVITVHQLNIQDSFN